MFIGTVAVANRKTASMCAYVCVDYSIESEILEPHCGQFKIILQLK